MSYYKWPPRDRSIGRVKTDILVECDKCGCYDSEENVECSVCLPRELEESPPCAKRDKSYMK